MEGPVGRQWGVRSLVAMVAALAPLPLYALNDQSVVINEVCVVPQAGQEKYVEILNRGTSSISTLNWWLCDHPTTYYERILQVPQGSGPPLSPGITLQPGDFLVVRLHPQFPPPSGVYTTRSNLAGTTTHILAINIPSPAIPSFLRSDHGNYSIWDHSPPSDPDNPSFDTPQFIRDFVAWGEIGAYIGLKRGCTASNPLAGLWSPPTTGDCLVPTPPPVFPAVDSTTFAAGSGISINYNGDSTNSPADYFLAPATEGEPNSMPGDMNNDLHMDVADSLAFVACLGQPATTQPCSIADFDHNGVVDCADWPLFSANWSQYSGLPIPPPPAACVTCVRGDINGDGLVDGNDIEPWIRVMTGEDTDAVRRCAADANLSGMIDCDDLARFTRLLLGSFGTCVPGDLNGDGWANGEDIQPFVNLLAASVCISVGDYCTADLNADLLVTADDVVPFVDALLLQAEKHTGEENPSPPPGLNRAQ